MAVVTSRRVAVVAAVGVVVAWLLHESNLHWVHAFATYQPVDHYPVSRAFGALLSFASMVVAAHHERTCSAQPVVRSVTGRPLSLSGEPLPILFPNAFPANATMHLLDYFAKLQQNQFAPCSEEKPLALGFESKPCLNSTFQEKQAMLDPDHPHSRRWCTIIHVCDEKEALELDALLQFLGFAPDFQGLFAESSIFPRINVQMVGTESSVPHWHAHPDYFIVFNLGGEKIFELAPAYNIPLAASIWSGLTYVGLVEPPSCVVQVKMLPGQALYVPSWWMHRTRLHQGDETLGAHLRQLGFSLHFAHGLSLAGHSLNVLQKLYGPTIGYDLDFLQPSDAKQSAIRSVMKAQGAGHQPFA